MAQSLALTIGFSTLVLAAVISSKLGVHQCLSLGIKHVTPWALLHHFQVVIELIDQSQSMGAMDGDGVHLVYRWSKS